LRVKILAGLFSLFICAAIFSFESKTANARDLELGIFLPGVSENIGTLIQFENNLGINFDSAKIYLDWDDPFPNKIAQNLKSHGTILEITWEPQIGGVGVIYSDVLNGDYDSYLNAFMTRVKLLDFNIRITLAPEMNGDWAPWGVGNNGNTPENFISFWQYVFKKFEDNNIDNVEWVWSPNVHYWGEKYTYLELFPGENYVDYLGLEGYNWGTSQSWSQWQTFYQVFYSSYKDLIKLSGKSILITEMASAEKGGSKAYWITKMFSDLSTIFPRIKGFTWFNMNKETDWRIESSNASKLAFINGVLKNIPLKDRPHDVYMSSSVNNADLTKDLSGQGDKIIREKVEPLVRFVSNENDGSNPSQETSGLLDNIANNYINTNKNIMNIIFWSIWSLLILIDFYFIVYLYKKQIKNY